MFPQKSRKNHYLNGTKTEHLVYFSVAAACKRVSCNGWAFWEYERAKGDWVLLDELRK